MAYHNMKISENDTKKTAFVLSWGQYEYTRVPFDLKTAPRAFQCAMNNILSGLEFVRVLLDDIIVFSSDEEQHLTHLITVLDRLTKHNVSINFEKSHFCYHKSPI